MKTETYFAFRIDVRNSYLAHIPLGVRADFSTSKPISGYQHSWL